MSNSLAEKTIEGDHAHQALARPTALLVATDGTPQSDAAVAFAFLLAVNNHADVKTVTVVEPAPLPWGVIDPSLVMEYERALHEDTLARARAQVDRLGDRNWTVEVQTGDPASKIATLARTSRARLVIVGLGGHGAAARLMGNETALQLMRTSETPVLAVDTRQSSLPKRIMVAMDFSESSIEAAQLALEIASPGATATLVHVVPWERKDYIPEGWFAEHESHIGAQLTRVAGWLDRPAGIRIHQKILYGKPGPALLACAEDLDADLLVAGTHGRGLVGRILGGETVAKLVRGTRRSMLVLPAAAAYHYLRAPVELAHSNGAGEV